MDVSGVHQKARAAMEKRNFAYAVEMFLQCLALQPEFMEARKDLRATSLRWYQERGGSKLSASLKNVGGLLKATIAGLTKDFDKQIMALDRCLTNDPENTGLLKKLGVAARKAGHTNAAVYSLEEVVEKKPQDVSAWRLLAETQEAADNVPAALHAYEKVQELKPADPDAPRRVKNLMAKMTMEKGKYEKDYRDSIKDENEAHRLEDRDHVIRTDEDARRAIEIAETDVENDPGNPRHLVKLADLHKRMNEFELAEEYYLKAREVDAADFTIQIKLGDLEIAKFQARIEKLKAQAAGGDTAARQQMDVVRKEQNAFMLEEYARRVKGQPTNTSYHFQYGKLLYASGMFQEAVSEFQYTVGDPRYKVDSTNYLGMSFAALGQFDLAEKQLRAGLEDMEIMTDRHKPLIYNLADLLEKAGRPQESKTEFLRLYEVDIKYRDVAERIQNLG